MTYRVLADATMLVHFAFIAFVVLGGLLALRWRGVIWIHLPAAVWGVLIELRGWTCPLTPLENHFRRLGGEAGYSGGFIERYLEPVIYPPGLSESTQLVLAAFVLVVNAVVYSLVRQRRARRASLP
ncbi:MAG: DUF2784 domain-containing protein [Gemmatimonadaceae bacterium]